MLHARHLPCVFSPVCVLLQFPAMAERSIGSPQACIAPLCSLLVRMAPPVPAPLCRSYGARPTPCSKFPLRRPPGRIELAPPCPASTCAPRFSLHLPQARRAVLPPAHPLPWSTFLSLLASPMAERSSARISPVRAQPLLPVPHGARPSFSARRALCRAAMVPKSWRARRRLGISSSSPLPSCSVSSARVDLNHRSRLPSACSIHGRLQLARLSLLPCRDTLARSRLTGSSCCSPRPLPWMLPAEALVSHGRRRPSAVLPMPRPAREVPACRRSASHAGENRCSRYVVSSYSVFSSLLNMFKCVIQGRINNANNRFRVSNV